MSEQVIGRVRGWSGRHGRQYPGQQNAPCPWLEFVFEVSIDDCDPAVIERIVRAERLKTPLRLTVEEVEAALGAPGEASGG